MDADNILDISIVLAVIGACEARRSLSAVKWNSFRLILLEPLSVFVPICSFGVKEIGTIPTSLKAFVEGRHVLDVGFLRVSAVHPYFAAWRLCVGRSCCITYRSLSFFGFGFCRWDLSKGLQ